ncbi:Uncharacterised protein [BD1-7 clade bacterium]|uniref:Uncharacterized protein n=1 Tax=BD1-7 clade bacterium TaxID=2029982 RepID=A0A5S9NXM8_9GAMM|nr:Uncharacterised protein [BD1-7 clade bacterium]CAA0096229.1 Uncharacterised protein [BD1-7 clade bacterium]
MPNIKMYSAAILATLTLVACSDDDKDKVERAFQDVNQDELKVSSDGLDGVWLYLGTESGSLTDDEGVFKNTTVEKQLVFVKTNGTTVIATTCDDQTYYRESGNKLLPVEFTLARSVEKVIVNEDEQSSSEDITIIDDNEIMATYSSSSTSDGEIETLSGSYRMVKIATDPDAAIANVTYSRIYQGDTESGSSTLTCLEEQSISISGKIDGKQESGKGQTLTAELANGFYINLIDFNTTIEGKGQEYTFDGSDLYLDEGKDGSNLLSFDTTATSAEISIDDEDNDFILNAKFTLDL